MNIFLKITLRRLYREKLYTLINIAGLSLGIACITIIGLYLHVELTYDRHFDGYENIYRVVAGGVFNGTEVSSAQTSPMLGPMMAEDNPGIIEDVVRFLPVWAVAQNENIHGITLSYKDRAYTWEKAYFATPNIFRIFSHDIMYGDPETALDQPASVAISETVANTYFGNRNPIGEVLINDNGQPQTVTLVFKDLPENTHLKYNVLYTWNNPLIKDPVNPTERIKSLFGVDAYTYFKVRKSYNPVGYAAVSKNFFDTHMKETAKAYNISWHSWLQPLADVHLYSRVGNDEPTGNLYYVYTFSAVALFILLIACINYVNLATARAAKRAREVGLQKILGCNRSSLIALFFTESLLYSFIAIFFGITIVEIALEYAPINELFGKTLTFSMFDEPYQILAALGLWLLVGLLSGIYPALYLSSWQPLNALAGTNRTGKAGLRFRSVLVFLQFCISVAVISCTILMVNQMRFVAHKNLGFKKKNQLIISLRGVDVIGQIPTIKAQLLKNSKVLGVSASEKIFGEQPGLGVFPVETNSGKETPILVNHVGVDKDFIEVMGLNLLEGHSFETRLLTDVGTNIIVNESFVRNMGWDDPIGKRALNGRVIGVVSDFNYKSLHDKIESFAFHTFTGNEFNELAPQFRPFVTRNLIVSISGEDVPNTLDYLNAQINKFSPGHHLKFRFLDDSLNDLYQSDSNLMKLIGIFSVICIFIACMGLFGLAAYTTEQRTKEIGIRKVLGASALHVVVMLSKNILLLVIAGSVLASITAYLIIGRWLQSFAYHTSISPLAFIIASLATLIIAFLTVSLQSFKTARTNPVEALRYE